MKLTVSSHSFYASMQKLILFIHFSFLMLSSMEMQIAARYLERFFYISYFNWISHSALCFGPPNLPLMPSPRHVIIFPRHSDTSLSIQQWARMLSTKFPLMVSKMSQHVATQKGVETFLYSHSSKCIQTRNKQQKRQREDKKCYNNCNDEKRQDSYCVYVVFSTLAHAPICPIAMFHLALLLLLFRSMPIQIWGMKYEYFWDGYPFFICVGDRCVCNDGRKPINKCCEDIKGTRKYIYYIECRFLYDSLEQPSSLPILWQLRCIIRFLPCIYASAQDYCFCYEYMWNSPVGSIGSIANSYSALVTPVALACL